jgi:hypothetical protein
MGFKLVVCASAAKNLIEAGNNNNSGDDKDKDKDKNKNTSSKLLLLSLISSLLKLSVK